MEKHSLIQAAEIRDLTADNKRMNMALCVAEKALEKARIETEKAYDIIRAALGRNV